MKKKIILVMLLTAILLFSGCDENSSNSPSAKTSGYSLKGTFNGGNTALDMEFTEGQPPEKIRDGGLQPFNIRVMVSNKGEYDIPINETKLVISGINTNDFDLNDSSKKLSELRGVKKQGENIIEGSIKPVIFNNLRYMPQLPSGVHSQNIYLDLCYPYKTKSLISLCISGNTLQNYDDELKVCDLESERQYANSGAPVIIENVRQSPAGSNSLMIQFDIVHKKAENSNGRIYKSGTLDDNCKVQGKSVTSSDAKIHEDYVKYTVETGIEGISCGSSENNTGTVLLSDDKTTVFCTQDTTGEEDYERPISVTLDYDYFDRKNTQVQIEHISQ